jgi:hypothetical protein
MIHLSSTFHTRIPLLYLRLHRSKNGREDYHILTNSRIHGDVGQELVQ